MPTLRERLVRIGFCATDVDQAIEVLGPDAHIDEAGHWIALAQIKRILDAAGMREASKPEMFEGQPVGKLATINGMPVVLTKDGWRRR